MQNRNPVARICTWIHEHLLWISLRRSSLVDLGICTSFINSNFLPIFPLREDSIEQHKIKHDWILMELFMVDIFGYSCRISCYFPYTLNKLLSVFFFKISMLHLLLIFLGSVRRIFTPRTSRCYSAFLRTYDIMAVLLKITKSLPGRCFYFLIYVCIIIWVWDWYLSINVFFSAKGLMKKKKTLLEWFRKSFEWSWLPDLSYF